MLSRLTFICIALALTGTASAEWLTSAELVTRIGYGHGTYTDDRNAATLELAPDLNFQLHESVEARLSARLRGDERDLLLPGEPNLKSYEGRSRPRAINDEWLAELRDAYVDVRLDNGTLRLGKQQLVWGALDGIKVLDVLNPQSFERFILEDFDESRIGLWSAYADLSLGDWRLETALIPDATTHYIPEAGAWFEFTAPRFRFGQTDPTATFPVIQADPEDERGTAAMRLSRYVGGVDVQMVALTGLEFEPLGRLVAVNGQPAVETYHERRSLFGVGFESSFAAFALRGEIAYSPKKTFNTRIGNALEDETAEHWRGGIGFDWDAPLGLFVNLQYVHDQVVSAPEGLIRPEEDRIATAFVKRRFFYDTLDIEARWYEGLEEGDRLFRALVSYQLSDHSAIKFSLDDFKGNARGVFGQFDQRDQLTLTFEHTF